MEKVFSFDEMLAVNDTKYDTVEVFGGIQRIGTLCSADMIEWIEDNDIPEKKREAGLRLLVKSLVDGDNNRVPVARREEFLEAYRNKDARSNGKIVRAALELNGLKTKAVELKNDSSEAPTGASPSGLPDTSEK